MEQLKCGLGFGECAKGKWRQSYSLARWKSIWSNEKRANHDNKRFVVRKSSSSVQNSSHSLVIEIREWNTYFLGRLENTVFVLSLGGPRGNTSLFRLYKFQYSRTPVPYFIYSFVGPLPRWRREEEACCTLVTSPTWLAWAL